MADKPATKKELLRFSKELRESLSTFFETFVDYIELMEMVIENRMEHEEESPKKSARAVLK